MRAAPLRIFSLVVSVCFVGAFGCAGVKQSPGGIDGGANSSGHGGTGNGSGTDGPPPPVDGITIITAHCGDGKMDAGEACDDGNKTPGDGCSAICQIPDGWTCAARQASAR